MKARSSKALQLITVALIIVMTSCTQAPVSKLKIQRPSKLQIPSRIKKIFIDPSQIQHTNDKLRIKTAVLKSLQNEINRQGRFQVFIGTPQGFDPNIESVAVIQGEIISGEQVEDGQVTEVATCKGGITGFAEGIAAAATSKQGVTRSHRGFLCKAGNFEAEVVSAGVGTALSLLGVATIESPVDEVVRVFKYKNVSIFTQLNLSLTEIGKVRETITIRSDNASFGRHIIQKASNVHESYLTMSEAVPLLRFPVTPLYIRRLAVVDASNPSSHKGKWAQYYIPKASHIPSNERVSILQQLIEKSILPFVRVISPYKVMAEISIAEDGDSEAIEYLKAGKWQKARSLLTKLSKRTPADEYNYGLTFEANALNLEDYEEAARIYLKALDKDPENKIIAAGIGRVDRRIKEAGILAKQMKK